MVQRLKRTCLLKMLENPTLGGILLGLRYDEDQLVVKDLEFFNCCSGTSTRFDEATQTSVHCSLNHRMGRLKEVFANVAAHWGEDQLRAMFAVPTARSLKILDQVSGVIKGYAPQATLFQSRGGDSLFYKMAVAAIWRFGLNCHVVNFKKRRSSKFNAVEIPANCEALFVEQIGELWDTNTAADLDHLISLAYHRNLCLWLEFIPAEDAAATARNGARAYSPFSRKIASLKGKDPLSYLRAETFSRLSDLTHMHRQTL